MFKYEDVLEKIVDWAKEAGKLQLQKLEQRDFKVFTKSDKFDLVTEVDQLSEDIIIGKIKEHFPDHAILSEESGVFEQASEYEWVIDPIDGTTNYTHGFPFFAVSIALKHKEEAIIGVVYLPKLDELYYAMKGYGAYLNGDRIGVSATEELDQALIATGFPYDRRHNPNNNLSHFQKILMKTRGIRRTGSAACDLCQVAVGRYDAYWEMRLSPWDIAAGHLIVEEAGGKVSVYEDEDRLTILGSNPSIHKTILKEFKDLDGVFSEG